MADLREFLSTLRQQKLSETQQLESKYSSLFEKFSSDEMMFEETTSSASGVVELGDSQHLMQDKLWQELVDVTQATAGASAVYLGILEQGEEAGRFINRSGKDLAELSNRAGIPLARTSATWFRGTLPSCKPQKHMQIHPAQVMSTPPKGQSG